jgi:outer membrane protein
MTEESGLRVLAAGRYRPVRVMLGLCLFLLLSPAGANSDPLVGVLDGAGNAGLGIATRSEQSLYRGGGTRNDFLPLYLYEGKHFYLHAYRLGLKLGEQTNNRFDVFLAHRFEGFPYDHIPASLAGMAERGPGIDAGISFQHHIGAGTFFGEFLHDISGASRGNELRAGYNHEWRSGGLRLRPQAMLAVRDADLNNYYYGVLPSEAAQGRPAYQPGSGVNGQLALYASYALSERWKLLAGISATRWAGPVRRSPIVDDRVQVSGVLGVAYDFAPEHKPWQERTPFIVKLMHGQSTDCNLLPVMELRCTSTQTADRTTVTGLEIGRPFIERVNGWPLDFVGYVGTLYHDERGLQPSFWQIQAYMKAFYYGFPWSDRVRTRIGFGAGVSYAQKIPFVEARDQEQRGRNTSKILNYLDPSIDVSVGDLLGVRSLRETYAGFGVSHRSGIFGTSQLLGNVNGGSNYIYSYVEWKM